MDSEPREPAAVVDPHRLAEVIVALPDGGGRRGSGYRVGPSTVLTAAHVVAGARGVRVRFDADTPGEWWVEASDVVADAASDLAVLVLDPPPVAADIRASAFGRVGPGTEELAVQAIGFPRFKLKAYSDPSDGSYRDSHQAVGSVAPLSNRRSGTFEVTVRPPEHDPDPRTSPWEGMSGAPLWAGERIIGVICEHHRSDGLGRLAATRIERLMTGAQGAQRLRAVLGLPPVADELPDVTAPPGWQPAASYRHQLLDVAPDQLLGRDTQLAELAAFTAGDEPYGWWQGEPWSGKTALMAWFALHPPPDTEVVAFLVAAGLAGQSDGDAFLEAVSEQLTVLAGRAPGAPATTAARRAGLLALLDAAASRCRASGRRLVLIVDGLDEDTGPTQKASIAALLPRRPPSGTLVLVTSRPDRPLPPDVPADHPLHGCVRRALPPSPHARDGETFARQELIERLRAGPLHEDLLGLITASGGGLGRDDLAALTGTSPFAVEELLAGAFGRSIATRRRQLAGSAGRVGAGRGYVLAHRTLHEIAENAFGARLEHYRDRLHAWAERYRDHGWPVATPAYLLRDYPRVLAMAGDRDRLAALATDPLRHDRMLEITGGDALALDEIALARLVGDRERRPDLAAAVLLAVRREELSGRNRQTPVRLPAVWAALGRRARAEALARGIPQGRRRTAALAAAALAAACSGHLDHAEALAARVPDPDRRDALLAAAAAAAAVHDAGRAERWARRCTPERRISALARVASAIATRDARRATALVAEVAAAADGPGARTAAAMAAVAVGSADLAEKLVGAIAPARQRTKARAELAVVLAATGDLPRAEAIASTMRQPGTRLPVLAALVQAAGPADRRCRLAELRNIARTTTHRGLAVGQLVALAVTMSADGDGTTAADLLTEAEHLVSGITEADRQDWAIARLAVARAALGDLEGSEAALDRVQDPDRRGRALTEIAVHAARTGAPERAESVVRRVPGTGRRMHALTDLAAAFAAHGDLARSAVVATQAEHMARASGDPRRLAVLATRVVDGLISVGELARARAVAGGISDPNLRGSALSRVADALAASGDAAGALAIARSLDDTERRAWVLVGVCEARAAEGGRAETVDAAAGTAAAIERHCGDDYSRVVALLRLSAAVRGTGATDEADRLVAAANATAENIADLGQRARAFMQLSVALDAVGDTDAAGDLARAATSALDRIDDPRRRDRALVRVVEALAVAGKTDRAEEAGRALTSPAGHVRVLAAIAVAAAHAEPDRAWDLLSRAEARLDEIDPDPAAGERATATGRLADAATTVLRAAGAGADDPQDPRRTWPARLVSTLLGGDGWLEAVPAVARLDRAGFASLVELVTGPEEAPSDEAPRTPVKKMLGKI